MLAFVARAIMSSNSPQVEALPCDFSRFVAQRRQLSEEAASLLLGEWLASYERALIAPSHVEGCMTTEGPARVARATDAGRPVKAA